MINHIRSTKMFERHLKKLKKKHYDIARLQMAISLIVNDNQEMLKQQFKWHMLKGDKAGIHEIHLDSNWLLLYQIISDTEITLLLLDTGSHDIL